MAQIPNRRSALAEIPLRMGMLRVSTDDIDDLGTLMDSPINNIPTSYLSPAPSPDELIIRQRGECTQPQQFYIKI